MQAKVDREASPSPAREPTNCIPTEAVLHENWCLGSPTGCIVATLVGLPWACQVQGFGRASKQGGVYARGPWSDGVLGLTWPSLGWVELDPGANPTRIVREPWSRPALGRIGCWIGPGLPIGAS